MSRPAGVTVIVPVLNGETMIGALLAALAAQLPHDLGSTEVLVVDNGSTDATRTIVAASGAPGVRLLEEPVRGPSAARNRGLAEARGDILALLDVDSVPSRRWLRELISPFADPAVLIAAGSLASYPPVTAAQRFAAKHGLNEASRMVDNSAIPFANTRNMAVRRSVAQAVGGWPIDMTVAEDVEFSFRVRARFGCAITYCERALAFHHDRATDDELWQQAFGYGMGRAAIHVRHPDVLSWGWRQRLLRLRRSAARRTAAGTGRLGQRLGLSDADSVEFARYLAAWDGWFWRGFDEGRRSARRTG